MTEFKVNDLKLPPLLCQLMQDGKWKFDPNVPISREALLEIYEELGIGYMKPAFWMCDLEDMLREVLPYLDGIETISEEEYFSRFFPKSFAWESSKRLGHPIDDIRILDIHQIVVIAINQDGEFLCLDYRESPDNPRVMGIADNLSRQSDSDYFSFWHMVAPDFQTFARKVGLID